MVQIKHFFAFILAAATVIAPVAAKKKHTVVTGTGYLYPEGDNLHHVTLQVQVDKKGPPTSVNYSVGLDHRDGELHFVGHRNYEIKGEVKHRSEEHTSELQSRP